jgi:hypothetical protein
MYKRGSHDPSGGPTSITRVGRYGGSFSRRHLSCNSLHSSIQSVIRCKFRGSRAVGSGWGCLIWLVAGLSGRRGQNRPKLKREAGYTITTIKVKVDRSKRWGIISAIYWADWKLQGRHSPSTSHGSDFGSVYLNNTFEWLLTIGRSGERVTVWAVWLARSSQKSTKGTAIFGRGFKLGEIRECVKPLVVNGKVTTGFQEGFRVINCEN